MLIIEEVDRKTISHLIQFSRENPISFDDLKKASMAQGDELQRWRRRLDDHMIALPFGYLVTYTQENQPVGLCHHILVSVDGDMPSPTSFFILLNAFDMGDVIAEKNALKVWEEVFSNGRIGVHVLSLV